MTGTGSTIQKTSALPWDARDMTCEEWEEEDANCTLITASILTGVPYVEIRKALRKEQPDLKLVSNPSNGVLWLYAEQVQGIWNTLNRFTPVPFPPDAIVGHHGTPWIHFMPWRPVGSYWVFMNGLARGYGRHLAALVDGQVYLKGFRQEPIPLTKFQQVVWHRLCIEQIYPSSRVVPGDSGRQSLLQPHGVDV